MKLTLFSHPPLGVCCVLELGCWVRWDPEQGSPLLRPRAAGSLLSNFYFIVAHNSESLPLFFFFIVASKGPRQRRVLRMLVVVQ